jgi:nucleoside-diphosphate-sugar epimerase
MRILITGAAGFIGGHFAHIAAASGHEVLGLIRKKTGAEAIRFCEGALTEAPWREILDFQPEVCLHAAWHAKPGMFWDAQENELCVNDSLTFIRALWSKIDCHVIAIGTCAEYASSPHPLSESGSVLKPKSGYARAKHLLREQLEILAAKHGQTLGWARIFYPYGPGEPRVKLTSSLINSALWNEALVINQPRSIKDFIHIDDLASALLGLLEIRATGPVNLASGIGVQIEELARLIVQITGKGKVEVRPSSTPDPLSSMVGSTERLQRLVSFRTKTSLRDGLESLRLSLDR